MAGDVGNPDPTRKMDDEELKEAMFYRLEGLGYRVGLGIVERSVMNLLRGSARQSWTSG